MHAITHTFAHRAPPASRTRARWQPYNSLPTYSCSSSSKSSSPYSTPATSLASPCQPTPTCASSSDRLQPYTTSLTTSDSLRDVNASKHKFALGLVDQAVKTLCEVWRPQDIPTAFSNPRTTKPSDLAVKVQLPESNCPILSKHWLVHNSTTTASTSIPTTSATFTLPCPSATPVLIQPGTSSQLRNLVPVRSFVHEVLRRSRTSGSVLQTALCYLEAIRQKIPELTHLEQIGKGTNGEPESGPRISRATDEELERSRQQEAMELSIGEGEATVRFADDAMDTVRIKDNEVDELLVLEGPSRNQHQNMSSSMTMDSSSTIEETEDLPLTSQQHPASAINSPTVPPLPQLAYLPSPLLCPRRAFLAALILASKFTQDKCYSNRAWAKLSGLPPREVGRCERALGSALEWRLWVGKAASGSPSSSPTPLNVAPVHIPAVRCQSESSLNMTSSPPPPPFKRASASESSVSTPETATASVAIHGHGRGTENRRIIRRAATLPVGVLSYPFNGTTNQFISLPCAGDRPASDASSRTLIQENASAILPSVFLHAPSPARESLTSALPRTPSPDMPGLSYSPSSVSSSPSSSCSSTGDRTQQMSMFFEDACNTSEYFNSPVAHITTRLLVPGCGNGNSTNGNTPTNKKQPSLLNCEVTLPPSSIPWHFASNFRPEL